MSQTTVSEVLTLDEAAAYLKLPAEAVEREADKGNIPGRRIADTWRFLRSAIDDWLRAPDSRASVAQQAGALKDDPYFDELLAFIEQQRQQPEVALPEAP
jgi:excisionase family DNA binding protein